MLSGYSNERTYSYLVQMRLETNHSRYWRTHLELAIIDQDRQLWPVNLEKKFQQCERIEILSHYMQGIGRSRILKRSHKMKASWLADPVAIRIYSIIKFLVFQRSSYTLL